MSVVRSHDEVDDNAIGKGEVVEMGEVQVTTDGAVEVPQCTTSKCVDADGSMEKLCSRASAKVKANTNDIEDRPATAQEINNDKYKTPCWQKIVLSFAVVFFLWVFLLGLGLMGDSFKVLGGKSAGNMFNWVTDPVVGLMVGVLATVLVQSSSTSTSIVVGLVGSGLMDVQTAIPIIMGANIGTSVTSTLVSLGQMNNKKEFERAFAGATVHDMFNYMAVCVFLPLEVIINALAGGSGGLLYWTSFGMTEGMRTAEGGKFDSPVKAVTSFFVKGLISVDKNKIKALSLGLPALDTCLGTPDKHQEYAKVSYYICGNQTALHESLVKYDENILKGSLVKGGAFAGTPDALSGTVCLVISLILLCGALYGIVRCLKVLVLSGNQKMWSRILNMNGYLAILVGAGLTISVQSSSIITSTLVPLVGLGTLSLEGMLPLTLGSNIGTTCTALLAALASGKLAALQIALCHLMFNVLGILVFYPIPLMRRQPIKAAKFLGYMTICYKVFPFFYIGIMFFVLPLTIVGLGQMMNAGIVGFVIGILLCVAIVAGIIACIYFWKFKGYDEKIKGHLAQKYEEQQADKNKEVTPYAADSQTEENSSSGGSPGGQALSAGNDSTAPPTPRSGLLPPV